ncbi:MAG: hypothetical protein Q8R40_06930 [bacterium]|nr:hypothetical protein [bacterium]
MPRKNFRNCWKLLRAELATARPETVNAKAKNRFGLDNQQPSQEIKILEGSETIMEASISGFPANG